MYFSVSSCRCIYIYTVYMYIYIYILLSLETYKWTRMTSEGPPPASRLDMAMCIVRLRTPVTPPQVQDTVAASIQAKDVLDSQLRYCY